MEAIKSSGRGLGEGRGVGMRRVWKQGEMQDGLKQTRDKDMPQLLPFPLPFHQRLTVAPTPNLSNTAAAEEGTREFFSLTPIDSCVQISFPSANPVYRRRPD